MSDVPTRSDAPFSIPLWLQVALAVALGTVLGAALGPDPILPGVSVDALGRLGMLVIRALKALAVPLVLFSILDALLRYRIEARSGWKLVRICAGNVAVAMIVGLTLVNVLQPGSFLRGLFRPLAGDIASVPGRTGALDPLSSIESFVPKSIVEPFLDNSVLGAVVLALIAGIALRRVRDSRAGAETEAAFATIGGVITVVFESLQKALGWVVRAVPLAAFCLVAQSVGKAGVGALLGLWAFLGVIALGLSLHAFLYYPFRAWVAGCGPATFLGGARDAIVTGVATNSSLATVPVTLDCLTRKLGVSQESARIATCIGTSLNNDGIALYEAMAVLVIAQACGVDLGLAQQAAVVIASLMAGIGIAGIPEAGLVMLPIVLAAAGLPEAVVAAAIPLVVPVDWILARLRTVVNVLSDMLVAVLLDADSRPDAATALAPQAQPEGSIA